MPGHPAGPQLGSTEENNSARHSTSQHSASALQLYPPSLTCLAAKPPRPATECAVKCTIHAHTGHTLTMYAHILEAVSPLPTYKVEGGTAHSAHSAFTNRPNFFFTHTSSISNSGPGFFFLIEIFSILIETPFPSKKGTDWQSFFTAGI